MLNGHTTAILIGLAVGIGFAFFRRGGSTGDQKPFSGR